MTGAENGEAAKTLVNFLRTPEAFALIKQKAWNHRLCQTLTDPQPLATFATALRVLETGRVGSSFS